MERSLPRSRDGPCLERSRRGSSVPLHRRALDRELHSNAAARAPRSRRSASSATAAQHLSLSFTVACRSQRARGAVRPEADDQLRCLTGKKADNVGHCIALSVRSMPARDSFFLRVSIGSGAISAPLSPARNRTGPPNETDIQRYAWPGG